MKDETIFSSVKVFDIRNLSRPPNELWHFGCAAKRTIYHYKAYSRAKHRRYHNDGCPADSPLLYHARNHMKHVRSMLLN